MNDAFAIRDVRGVSNVGVSTLPTRPPQAAEYFAHLDLVKVCAIVLVVVVHVAATGAYLWGAVPIVSWWTAAAFDAIARICVPLFLMASGATLLDSAKVEPVTRFLARRVRRIAVPLLLWSLIYLADRKWVLGEALSVGTAARYLIAGTTFYHMPFFYYLFGLYLSAPILARFAEQARGGTLAYLVVLWLLTTTAQLICSLLGVPLGISVPAIAGYSGYFMLGRMLRDTAIGRGAIPLCLLIVAMAWVATLFGTYLQTSAAGHLVETMLGYGQPNVIAMALCTYLALASRPVRDFFAQRQIATRRVRQGAALSFGIFLVHPLLLQLVLPLLRLDWRTGGPMIGVPLTTIVTLCLSGALVAALIRLPLIRSAVS